MWVGRRPSGVVRDGVRPDCIGPPFLVADIANRSAALLAVVLTNAALGDVVPPSSPLRVGRHTGVALGASMLCGPLIGTFAHARLGGVRGRRARVRARAALAAVQAWWSERASPSQRARARCSSEA